MKYKTQTFTVEKMVQIIADNNISNRSVMPAHVDELAALMSGGEWQETGDPIRFGKSGRLLDGQHRMMAAIKAGIPLTALVITDLDDEVMPAIDSGKVRTLSDVLTWGGHVNTRNLAAMLNIIHSYNTHVIGTGVKVASLKGRIKKMEVLDIARLYPEAQDSLLFVWRESKAGKFNLVESSSLAAFHYLARCKSAIEADEFVSSLCRGEMLSASDPEYLLRRRLMESSKMYTAVSRNIKFAWLTLAWNQKRSKAAGKFIRFAPGNNEKFPIIK